MAAVRGRPTLVMLEPILEIAWPPQSLRKSRSRVRGPEGISTVWHGGSRGPGTGERQGCQLVSGRRRRKSMAVLSVPGQEEVAFGDDGCRAGKVHVAVEAQIDGPGRRQH